ncbi:MAG: hypothetical protein ABJA71_17010 [Ginsengibacter sp.]
MPLVLRQQVLPGRYGADQVKLPFVYVRAKVHGTANQIEGL